MLWDCFWGHFWTKAVATISFNFWLSYMHLLSHLTSNFHERRYWGWQNSRWGDINCNRRTTGELSSAWYTLRGAEGLGMRLAKRGVQANPFEPPLPTGLMIACPDDGIIGLHTFTIISHCLEQPLPFSIVEVSTFWKFINFSFPWQWRILNAFVQNLELLGAVCPSI